MEVANLHIDFAFRQIKNPLMEKPTVKNKYVIYYFYIFLSFGLVVGYYRYDITMTQVNLCLIGFVN